MVKKARNVSTRKTVAPAPAGMKIRERVRCEGFFEMEKGNTFVGKKRGTFTTQGDFGPRQVVRVEITDGRTKIRTSEGEIKTVAKGVIIGVNISGYLKDLVTDYNDGDTVGARYEGEGEAKGKGRQAPHVFTTFEAE